MKAFFYLMSGVTLFLVMMFLLQGCFIMTDKQIDQFIKDTVR